MGKNHHGRLASYLIWRANVESKSTSDSTNPTYIRQTLLICSPIYIYIYICNQCCILTYTEHGDLLRAAQGEAPPDHTISGARSLRRRRRPRSGRSTRLRDPGAPPCQDPHALQERVQVVARRPRGSFLRPPPPRAVSHEDATFGSSHPARWRRLLVQVYQLSPPPVTGAHSHGRRGGGGDG